MRKTLLTISTIFTALIAYVFDIWNLQTYLQDKNLVYEFEFPPMNGQEYALWIWLIVASICTGILFVYVVPGVKISGLKRASSVKFGEWYGVNVRRIGSDCECVAEARLWWPRQRMEPIQLSLRTRNQWEQQEQRQDEVTPFNLRQIPKFLPIFMVRMDSDTPYFLGLDQTEAQWRPLRQDVYRVDIKVSHGSFWPDRRRIYIDFDGERIGQIGLFRYRRDRNKYRKQRTLKDITASQFERLQETIEEPKKDTK